MSRWFRWYEGTTEDGKFRVVARLSRVTVRDVIALWAFILEDAAHLDHRGVCVRNEDFMASILDFDDGVVERILSAMESADMISVGHGAITICNWGKRQFESDADPTAADRQRRHRDKQRATNAPVTRDSRPPETEADTEPEKKEEHCAVATATRTVAREKYSEDFEKFWQPYPRTPVMAKKEALKAWKRLEPEDRTAAISAVPQYVRWLKSKPDHPAVHACRFLSQRRFDGFDEPQQNGEVREIFVPIESPKWGQLCARWREENRKTTGPPPRDYPVGSGWYFPKEWAAA